MSKKTSRERHPNPVVVTESHPAVDLQKQGEEQQPDEQQPDEPAKEENAPGDAPTEFEDLRSLAAPLAGPFGAPSEEVEPDFEAALERLGIHPLHAPLDEDSDGVRPEDITKRDLAGQRVVEDEDGTLQKVLDGMAKLTAEQHKALQEMGWTIPVVQSGTTVHDSRKVRLGYQCRECREPGLYFVGDKFLTGKGTFSQMPPLDMHIAQISWSQPMLKPGEVVRGRPHCQFCGAQLLLTADLRLRRGLVINIEHWLKWRAAQLQKNRSFRVRGVSDPAGRGENPKVSSIYDVMDEVTPGRRQALETISKHVNMGELAFGTAANPRR